MVARRWLGEGGADQGCESQEAAMARPPEENAYLRAN